MILKKIILLASIIELIVIVVLTINVVKNKNDVLGTKVSINPIKKEDLIFPKEGTLKYFYEPKANKDITNKPDWLPADYTYTATINADSLNERFDYSIEKSPDVFRIITLGDSFTFGVYVNTNENYPERLEDMLNNKYLCKSTNKFEVINLGVQGYDIEYAVNRFAIRGEKYKPDLVLWYKINNGDFTKINEFYIPKTSRFVEEISSDSALLAEYLRKGNYYRQAKKNIVQEFIAEIGEERIIDYKKKALDRINDYYKGSLIFFTYSGRLNGSYLSILQNFIQGRNNTYFYDGLSSGYDRFEDGHPSSKGYEQIASEIFDYLKQNGFVPCN